MTTQPGLSATPAPDDDQVEAPRQIRRVRTQDGPNEVQTPMKEEDNPVLKQLLEPKPLVAMKPSPGGKSTGAAGVDVKNLSLERLRFVISYVPLCAGKVQGIPSKLMYRPIDGVVTSILNEMNDDELDNNLNSILDMLCYQSQYEGFSHWEMPNPEKMRAWINLRINSIGEKVETCMGVCTKCGKGRLMLNVNLLQFDEKELAANYKEPFPLKYKTGAGESYDKESGEKRSNVREIKFTARMIRSGDLKKAQDILDKNQEFVKKMFPGMGDDRNEAIKLVLEYANTIIEHDGVGLSYEAAVQLCSQESDLMSALTFFNNNFDYGLKMEMRKKCDHPMDAACKKVHEDLKHVMTDEDKERGFLFQVPIQPAFFYNLGRSEGDAEHSYFDQ